MWVGLIMGCIGLVVGLGWVELGWISYRLDR